MRLQYRVMNPHKGYLCLNELELGMPLRPPMLSVFRMKLSAATLRKLLLEAYRFKVSLDRNCQDAANMSLGTRCPQRGSRRPSRWSGRDTSVRGRSSACKESPTWWEWQVRLRRDQTGNVAGDSGLTRGLGRRACTRLEDGRPCSRREEIESGERGGVGAHKGEVVSLFYYIRGSRCGFADGGVGNLVLSDDF